MSGKCREKEMYSLNTITAAKVFKPVSAPTSRKFSLSVVKVVRGVWRPVVMVSGGKFILHKAWWESSKVVWWRRGLVERRWLLVGRKRPSEMGRSL